ncbi:phage tail protein [[Bacillus] enclensis]|uniref:Phage tail assembly chaperone protein, TAC n=1 Tax=[Bacillus] enclensis TaxID=1402860 RepID=A0A0V8HLT5_9BACI|nr:tail assembly chaperone [[Bacillus] enclensis]KSU63643.1 phage tail protein [[Bacillus] enclensis]SCB87442.1 Phage tail assembly chaperone protein, TAC [[Bacillus] enclensis]
MHITFNGRDIELSFGLRTLTTIDRSLGLEVENVSLGQGLETMLVPGLQSGNIICLYKLIQAATAHDKKKPKTEEDFESILNDIAENEGLDEFAEQVMYELGKQPMTRKLVPEEYQKGKVVKEASKTIED